MDEDTHPLLLLLPLVSFIQIKPTHGEQFCATVRGWAVCRLYEKATEHMNGPPRIDMHLIYSDCGAVPRGKALRRGSNSKLERVSGSGSPTSKGKACTKPDVVYLV